MIDDQATFQIEEGTALFITQPRDFENAEPDEDHVILMDRDDCKRLIEFLKGNGWL